MGMNNTINSTTKDIKAAINEGRGLNVYHNWAYANGGEGRARICDARTKGGKVQVKHLQAGRWIQVAEADSIILA